MVQELSVLVMFGICSLDDAKKKQIHLGLLSMFAAEGILCGMFLWERPAMDVMAAMVPGLAFFILSFATHGGIGEGDGLILIVAGFFLEVSRILSILMYAVFLSAGCAMFLLLRKKGRKYEMPFIPFLLLAFVGEIFLQKFVVCGSY